MSAIHVKLHNMLTIVNEGNNSDGQTLVAKFNFCFFCPDSSTLKFLKVKCNPTNKNIVALLLKGVKAICVR